MSFNQVIWSDGGFREEVTVEVYLLPKAVARAFNRSNNFAE
jgi:hypothetical protein